MKEVVSGNAAAAYGAKLARAQVVAAYPITPQTTVVEKVAEFIANEEYQPKFIKVESEHSAMAACISASQTGARTFTATAAHGLALMHELLHWAAAARTPVIMSNINRAMGPPWNVWADHTDSMSQRDTGWIQIYALNNQEVFDSILQAYKVGEDHDIMLPVMVNEDAFFLSHTIEPVEIPEPEMVDDFLPPFDPEYKLDPKEPHGFGSLSMPHQWYMELRYKIAEGHEKALPKLEEVQKEFKDVFGREYHIIDEYRCEDAEIILIGIGTMAGTAQETVDELREEGVRVGFARIRLFRPFPVEHMRSLMKRAKFVGVLDRSFTFGYEGQLFTEIKAALYGLRKETLIKDYVVGIGGRDITIGVIKRIIKNAEVLMEKGELDREIEWVDLKGAQDIHFRRRF